MVNSLKVGIIGDTGRGNYGHGLDLAYEGLDEFDVVAVSDPDPIGLKDAVNRIGVSRYYKDYREMLDKEQLDVVNVCPRWVGKHKEMIIAASDSGVKAILCEKPIAATLAQADEIMESCNRNGVRVAIAHRRANMYEEYGKKIIERGDLGNILSIKARGKEDHRSGATDLMVLGIHLMDSMRYMAGTEVEWAYGRVTQNGNEISIADVREGDEEIGLIAGNGVSAFYSFSNGISGYFESHPQSVDITKSTDTQLTRSSRSFGFEVHGTEGIISIRCSPVSEFYQYPHGQWVPDGIDGNWERIRIDDWDIRPDGSLYTANERMHMSNKVIAREIHAAIVNDRDIENVSSGEDAVKALEMIMAIHESQIVGSRVYFPMKNRDNPYANWLKSE